MIVDFDHARVWHAVRLDGFSDHVVESWVSDGMVAVLRAGYDPVILRPTEQPPVLEIDGGALRPDGAFNGHLVWGGKVFNSPRYGWVYVPSGTRYPQEWHDVLGKVHGTKFFQLSGQPSCLDDPLELIVHEYRRAAGVAVSGLGRGDATGETVHGEVRLPLLVQSESTSMGHQIVGIYDDARGGWEGPGRVVIGLLTFTMSGGPYEGQLWTMSPAGNRCGPAVRSSYLGGWVIPASPALTCTTDLREADVGSVYQFTREGPDGPEVVCEATCNGLVRGDLRGGVVLSDVVRWL